MSEEEGSKQRDQELRNWRARIQIDAIKGKQEKKGNAQGIKTPLLPPFLLSHVALTRLSHSVSIGRKSVVLQLL